MAISTQASSRGTLGLPCMWCICARCSRALTRSVVSMMKPLPTHSEGFGGRTFACSLSLTLTPGKAVFTAGSVFLKGFSSCVLTTLGT